MLLPRYTSTATARCWRNSLARFLSEAAVPSTSVPFSYVQSGAANLEATETSLVYSHKAPCRWIVPKQQQPNQYKVATLSHYGGGMASGDTVQVQIDCRASSRVCVTTQGTNRVYKSKAETYDDDGSQKPVTVCKYRVTLDDDAELALLPDPTQLQAGSNYRQHIEYHVAASSKVIAVDWISAGRLSAGERWQGQSCSLTTKLFVDTKLQLVDAQSFLEDGFVDVDWNQFPVHCFGSILLYNVDERVQERFRAVQRSLCASVAAVRTTSHNDDDDQIVDNSDSISTLLQQLAGRVVLGHVTETKLNLVRFAASSNEDVYRILEYCFQDLEVHSYKQRINTKQSAPVTHVPVSVSREGSRISDGPKMTLSNSTTSSKSLSRSAYMLADSALPIGSFAHSFGLEAAHQLDALKSSEHLEAFLRATTRSSLQSNVPIMRLAHQLTRNFQHMEAFSCAWTDLNEYAHAMLASNPPASRASLDQAKSLIRLVQQLDVSSTPEILDALKKAHLASAWGVVCCLLNVDVDEACDLWGYCVSRDIVSAAVRLNLVGPLAGQQLLWDSQVYTQEAVYSDDLETASGCAPVLELIQTNHDDLANRLFRS